MSEGDATASAPSLRDRWNHNWAAVGAGIGNPASLRGLFAALAGTAVLMMPQLTTTLAQIIVIAAMALSGVTDLVYTFSRKDATYRGIRAAGGVTAIAVGVLASQVPDETTDAVIASVAVCAIVLGLVLVAWGFRRQQGGSTLDPATATVPTVLWDWIRGSDVGERTRAESVTIGHDVVTVALTGVGEPPDPEALQAAMSEALDPLFGVSRDPHHAGTGDRSPGAGIHVSELG